MDKLNEIVIHIEPYVYYFNLLGISLLNIFLFHYL